ncbi:hypothetical protein B0A52_07020 [Exophiala mesophila]|uniref:Zn(2)-C6 fungal-type domain-containing protein n=1 Tax=Exophiala mesophila TaxID=212818 RepID=A0A438MZH3_EXOME|nr:hypothetical protein B0A52_07020 [Exophiala mesophila]
MNGMYDHGINMPEQPYPNMMEQSYPIYDGGFNAPYPRLSGPATHFDGVAFWYNPTNNDQMYERDPNIFASRGAITPNAMDSASIKHRRTRSGCFTCRSRRVKCDETRPICDRCKKGGRECEFPQTNSSSKRSRQGEARSPKDQQAKHEAKSERNSNLETIKDESEEEEDTDFASTADRVRPSLGPLRTDSTPSTSSIPASKRSEASTAVRDHISPQSPDLSDARSRDETPASSMGTAANTAEVQARQAKIRALKPDIQKYLRFQQEYMNNYHYFYKLDPTDFLHGELIDLALGFEPLLYAIVGFAAYHYELRQKNPKLSHFLGYHSSSMSMLRKSLEQNAKVTEATIFTILQLATFEEYIGDWVNLVGHHRAAFTMLQEMYTADTINDTELGRRLFSWYARLDVVVGLMAGNETRLERRWFETNGEWYRKQMVEGAGTDLDLENTLAYFVTENRLLGMDMAALYARLPKREISVEEFHTENAKLEARLGEMKRMIEAKNDASYRVQEFPMERKLPLNEADIVNPYVPGGLFTGALWPLNHMWLDWYGIELMQKYQIALMFQKAIPDELEQLSLEVCRIYEAIERWPDAPNDCTLAAHATLGLALILLRKDKRHIMWARKKLAGIERMGYIYPYTFRRKMAELWGLTNDEVGEVESVESWWLPNNEGNIPILTEMRRVVNERHEADGQGMESLTSVRDVKSIFARLDIRSQGTQKSSASIEGISPRSDISGGGQSDRGSSTSSFSPTNPTFGDTRIGGGGAGASGGGSIASVNQENGSRRKPKRVNSGS